MMVGVTDEVWGHRREERGGRMREEDGAGWDRSWDFSSSEEEEEETA